jgi:hypothetical protein
MMPELQKFADRISIIDGPLVRAMGIPFPTRMIIVKLSNSSLRNAVAQNRLRL